jgi:hypothetical protein
VCRVKRMCSLIPDAVKSVELELRERTAICDRPNRMKSAKRMKDTRVMDGTTFKERSSFSFKWRYSSGVSYNLQGAICGSQLLRSSGTTLSGHKGRF